MIDFICFALISSFAVIAAFATIDVTESLKRDKEFAEKIKEERVKTDMMFILHRLGLYKNEKHF